MRRELFQGWSVVAVLSLWLGASRLTCANPAAEETRPMNVVFVLADDLGWADTSLYGKTDFYRTPNLARLAERGVRFTRAYSSSPLCSPTRSAILTGLSPARTGITAPQAHLGEVVLRAESRDTAAPDLRSTSPTVVTRLSPHYETLAEVFRTAGYATGHFGKWHLGHAPYSPLEHGFQVDIPHHPGPGPAGSYVAPWKFADFTPKIPHEHIEDRMADEAVAWMERHRESPFFLNYWMFSVHAPFDAKERYIEENLVRVNLGDAQHSPTYAAMIQSLDDAIGKLLDAIDRLGLEKNTVIIFTSDNGGNMYSEVDGTVPTSNRPLRGGKATIFEGGTRVPAVVVWPGITCPGTSSDQPIQSEDYFPTLVEGLQLTSDASQELDGISVLAALRGSELPERSLIQFFPHSPPVPDWVPPSVSIHRGDWKLIRIFHGGENGAHRYQLYNLVEDIGEQRDISSENPDLVRELDQEIDQFLLRTNAVVPLVNRHFDPLKYDPSKEGKARPANHMRREARRGDGLAEDAPVLQGWKPRGVTATISAGIMRLQATGNEPFLGFAAGKLSPESSLRFRLRCEGGMGKVVWLSSPTAPPQGSDAVQGYACQSGEWCEIEVPVVAKVGQAGIIRFFLPIVGGATTELDWIELHSNGRIRRWDF